MRQRMLATLGLLGLLAVIAPMLVRGSTEELARRDERATADWEPVAGVGLGLKIPQGWEAIVPEAGVGGMYLLRLAAPTCAEHATPGCANNAEQAPLTLDLAVERLDNTASGPGDEFSAAREREGFTRRPVTVGGIPAALLSAPAPGSIVDQLIVIEREGVRYQIATLSSPPPAESAALALLLGTLELDPTRAPLPGVYPPTPPGPAPSDTFRLYLALLDQGAAGSAEAAIESPRPAQASGRVPFSTRLALEEAHRYAQQEKNRDECYIYGWFSNGRLMGTRCQKESSYQTPLDGPHFVSCVLSHGRLDGVSCNGLSSNYLSSQLLRSFIEDKIPFDSHQATNAQPGDVFFVSSLNTSNVWETCWSGIVTGRNNDGSLVAALHSIIENSFINGYLNPEDLWCGNKTRPRRVEYFSIRGDDTPPEVLITAPKDGAVVPALPTRVEYSASDPAVDGEPGSGVRDYSVSYQIDSAPPTLYISPTLELAQTLPLRHRACSQVTIMVSAWDNADNEGQASVTVNLTLPGDLDLDKVLDEDDLAAAEAALGLGQADPGYQAVLDVTGDGLIDSADTLWIHRHLGDRCE